ncbi:MAG: biphenyl 2,3-dioxygenase [Gammaproteobacteria bacterium]|nr:biphenyl 2,3-dioxygenase [Gammaproteobacteria bacterium]
MSRVTIVMLMLFFVLNTYAAGDMTAQQAVEIRVDLGDKKNRLRFFPERFELETGKLYKLVIKNPSLQKHYFSSAGLASAVFTRKVQVVDRRNQTQVEVKGTIKEIEVYPGNTAEWWFVPVKTLSNSKLYCTIKGHSEAGMSGSISIR